MALRILLADDEKEFVDTLAERLSLRGYAPYVVYDGISALQAATPEKPDVVVLDLFMPGLSGDEVLRRLKVLYPDLPVILLTGHEAVDDIGKAVIQLPCFFGGCANNQRRTRFIDQNRNDYINNGKS